MMRWLLFLILLVSNLYAEDPKDSGLIDFKAIKDVLKKDMIDDSAQKKADAIKKAEEEKARQEVSRYNIPREEEFWSFFSEWWLVRNAPVLKWDFEKPDYGLTDSFKKFLEDLGYYEKVFKILLVDSPSVTHMALPSNNNEFIFILSVPFIRTLDLSKLEISILLFEDLIRIKQNYFKEFVQEKELLSLLGTNYHGKKIEKEILLRVLKKYDEIIFDKGFNFAQQFQTTKIVGDQLKADLRLWNNYLGLIRKIDDLVKSNLLYKDYPKIFPSPELQLGWLIPTPEKK